MHQYIVMRGLIEGIFGAEETKHHHHQSILHIQIKEQSEKIWIN